ncbi:MULTISPECIES: hypothetical protein [Streptomyces]|uniref:hypothetical protein n=1 Tax=Streptomyces TaxID=1883 RepID=UPI00287FCD0F|nr:hypothetical protein [Streptomyces sp. CGMCC 4.1456]WNF63869.1 hypothetical protein RJD14_15365 [Streptomyces sp. CGMCC 4.1456]
MALPVALVAITRGSALVTPRALGAGLATLVLLPDLCQERSPACHSRTRSTARTLTGPRSVDLTWIVSVRVWTTFSPGGVQQRVLLVRDVHGVRLGLTTAAGRRALRAARAAAGQARSGDSGGPSMTVGDEGSSSTP